MSSPDYRYPRDYTDRQLLESIWRKIDGLAAMVMSKVGDEKNLDDVKAFPDLATRLVRAVVEALGDDDPMLLIGIASNEIQLSWPADPATGGCATCGHRDDDHRCLLDQCCMQCACGGFKENM
jgi:hypothetical protein